MSSVRCAALAALVALSACTENTYYTTQDEASGDAGTAPVPGPGTNAGSIDEDDHDGEGNAQDAGALPFDSGIDDWSADASAPPGIDSGIANGASVIGITAPSSRVTRVTATVNLQMAVQGARADYVDVLVDGALLASLPLPYQFAWDTSYETEGPHTVAARAMRGGVAVAETSRELVVDRTPPELVRMIPESGTKQLPLDTPLILVFSEPIAAESIIDTITVEVGGKAQAFSATVQTDGTRVELRLQKPAPTLPATATIGLGAIHDLAGVSLRITPRLSVSYPAWGQMGASLPDAGTLDAFASDGKELWALLSRFDNIAQVTGLRAAHWDAAQGEWIVEELAPRVDQGGGGIFGIFNVSRPLTIDSQGRPLVAWRVRLPEQPSRNVLRRRQPDGTWVDLPALPAELEAGGISQVATEPDGSVVVAVYGTVQRLSGTTWSQVGEPTDASQLLVSEHGLTVVTQGCRIKREGAAGWVDLGVPQTAGGCTNASLFARPGSNLAAFVSYSVTVNNSTTTSTAVLEHVGGTKWRPATFGVPPLTYQAPRSKNDLLFISTQGKTVYDARADPMVQELPGLLGRFVVWEGAPVMAVTPDSFASRPLPLSFYVLNHIK